jgi:hypothetical protein
MINRDHTTLVERCLPDETESLNIVEFACCVKSYLSADLDVFCYLATHSMMDQLGCPRLQDRFFRR